jgi:hypothetical protein
MLDILLATLFDIINTNHDYNTGNADLNSLNETKKRFIQALGEFVDFRIREALDERRTALSQERLAVADSINATIKSTASTIKSFSALNSAPPPANDKQAFEEWMKQYTAWYENNRKNGMDIG